MKTLRHPATVIAAVALFAALGGGGIAYASGLISGSRIKNHSIQEKKLTRSAIQSLHGQRGPTGPPGPKGGTGAKGDTGPQGPGAISFIKTDLGAGGSTQIETTIDGLDVFYGCGGGGVQVGLQTHLGGADTLYASGDYAVNGTLSSLQTSGTLLAKGGTSTVNLDVIAWAGSVGIISRFDLGGYFNGVSNCNIWGLITPGTS